MSSPARRMRRQQARHVAKQLTKAHPPMEAPEPPSPAEVPVADRLAQHGVQLHRSILWTPGAR